MLAGDPIEATQAALGLKGRDALFADLLGVTEQTLRDARSGVDAARREVLEAAALALGVEGYELVDGGIEGRANTVLLRSLVDPESSSTFQEVVAQNVHRALGGFTRTLRRRAWLLRALGRELPTLPVEVASLARTRLPTDEAPYGAEVLAERVRESLGLGAEPIESMVALVRERLGIAVHTTRSLWSSIDGAAYSFGGVRGVLVNCAETPQWFSVRMTLAHELCHVLFDGGALEGARGAAMLMYSPAQRETPRARLRSSDRPRASSPFQLREQRANAFAAYLLAPPSGVRALFGRHDAPLTVASVDRLATRYGLSRLTALNVLQNVFRWYDSDRQWLLERIAEAEAVSYPRTFPEVLPGEGDADATLRTLADEAVGQARMSPVMRDRWFGLVSAEVSPRPLAGDHPQGHWTDRDAPEAAGEILGLCAEQKTDAALRVLWDSVRAWLSAGQLERVRLLLERLPAAKVSDHIVVNVLLLLKRERALAGEWAAYERAARASWSEEGRSPESIEALLVRVAS